MSGPAVGRRCPSVATASLLCKRRLPHLCPLCRSAVASSAPTLPVRTCVRIARRAGHHCWTGAAARLGCVPAEGAAAAAGHAAAACSAGGGPAALASSGCGGGGTATGSSGVRAVAVGGQPSCCAQASCCWGVVQGCMCRSSRLQHQSTSCANVPVQGSGGLACLPAPPLVTAVRLANCPPCPAQAAAGRASAARAAGRSRNHRPKQQPSAGV